MNTEFIENAVRQLGDLAKRVAAPSDSLLSYSANFTERQRSDIRTAAKHSVLLLRRMGALGRLGRLRRGPATLSYARFNLAALVREVAAKFQESAGGRDVRFDLQAPDRLEAELDPEWIEQVVLNLLVHAYKTAASDGAIECRLVATDGECSLEVRSGPLASSPDASGIDPDAVRIQEAREPSPAALGDGLALEIAAAAVRLHGGTISALDEHPYVCYRARFSMTAPEGRRVRDESGGYALRTESLMIQGAIEEIDESPVGRIAPIADWQERPLVLVVEDDPVLNDLICETLEVEFRIVGATDGSSGLERSIDLRPDLIIADLTMPQMSGGEMIARIRQTPELDRVPIIVLSGNDDQAQRIRLLREGVQDYVTKPVSTEELRARVRNQVMIKRTRDILEDDLLLTSASLEDLARNAAVQKREFEASNRLRDEFVSTLSHELRTPLTSIHGWVRLLQTERPAESIRRQAVDSIERNVRTLTSRIEELLDLSRIVTGNVALDIELVELNPVVAGAVESIRIVAESRDVSIRTRFDSTTMMVLGDARRLKQVVDQLVSNAVKFARPGGSVEVAVEPLRSKVEIRVEDDGEGISPEFLPHVFDSFRQADASTSRPQLGLGLGLAIVKALVELHGGTVKASSEGLGLGSRFSVRLPVFSTVERADVRPEPLRFPVTTGGLESLKVLVAEDDADTRSFLTFLLEQSHARVRAYSEADQAIDAFRQWRPDLLLCDIGLPRKDGYELIREIRTGENGPPVPAIALTAYTAPEDQERALEAGFQAHLSKPIDPAVLLKVIQQFVRGSDGKD